MDGEDGDGDVVVWLSKCLSVLRYDDIMMSVKQDLGVGEGFSSLSSHF